MRKTSQLQLLPRQVQISARNLRVALAVCPLPATRTCTVWGREATHVDFVRLDLVAGRHRRGLFSVGHDATAMLHTLSNLTGKTWHKDQEQESRCKS